MAGGALEDADCRQVSGSIRMAPAARRFAAQLAIALPELGWSVSETSIMPLLLKLDIPPVLLSANWLCSPVLGMLLHPLLGRLSDKHGRRPFVVVLGLASAIGLALMPTLASAAGTAAGLAAFFLVFGIVDTSHDLLLTPTRAAMNDVYAPRESELRSAVAGGCGKVAALLGVVLLGGERAFAATAAIIVGVVFVQLLVPRAPAIEDGARTADLPLAQAAQVEEARTEDEAGTTTSSFPPGFAPIWVVSCGGWFAVCVLSFGITSAWAERSGALPDTPEFERGVKLASVLLMGSTGSFIVSGGALPLLVRLAGGHFSALVIALVAMATTMVSFASGCPDWATAACIIVLYPPSYQIVANAPFGWLEEQPAFSASERGRLTGWFNSSLAVAQAVTSVFTGPVVALAHGRIFASFAVAAALCFAIAAATVVAALCRRRREVGE
mmetsp:Transcript_102814/g.297232  ORF Transcript_102814/g.297232 Transcript_102814/m.297232 type:complete len:441 (-) Transcript_102814:349-1671(-)